MKFFTQFFICGIFTSLLLPPFFLTPLGFVIFPYLFYLLTNKEYCQLSFTKHFISGFSFGLGFLFIYLGWIKEPFYLDQTTKKFSYFSYLLILYCSLYFGLVFFIIKYFKKRNIKFIMLPILIVLVEFICTNISYGFPWLSFSLIHSSNIIGSSLIYFVGTYGLTYLSILIFLFPSVYFLNNKKLHLIFYFFLFSFIIMSLISRINPNVELNNKGISIDVVQLNSPMNENMNLNNARKKAKKIVDIIKKSKAKIIIFAENDYPFLMSDDEILFLQDKINDHQSLIIGSTRIQKKIL